MKNRMLSWVLALSLLLTMLPVSAMAAEDERAGDGLPVTETTQCTCGAEPDEAGTVTHTDGCPLYEAPACSCGAAADTDGVTVHQEGCPLYEALAGEEPPAEDGCTCGAEPDETGTIAHADGCPLYEAPACTCGAEPNEAGTVTHADGCPLYEAPVCTCGAEPDETGAVTHADGCPLYEAPACTCGAEPDETGTIAHADGCSLYEAPVCTCGAEPDADGAIVHQEGCPLYEAPVVEEPPVEDLPAEELPAEEPGLDAPGFSSMGKSALLTGTADHSNHTGWTQLSRTISSNSFYQDGNYYLNGDVSTYQGITISNDVTLCLNGHTLNMGTNTLTVSSGATLTICDCQSGGTIKGSESHINLNVISVTGGTLNLESGTISGTTTGSGSLISITDSGTLNVTGGTISLNHTGKGAQLGVQAVELSNSTGSFTGGEVSLTTAVENARATTVYQEGGSVTVGGSAEIVFEWTTTEEKPNSAPGYGALCVTQNGSVTVKDNCTITASRTGGEMAGAVSIGTLNDATGTATINGGDINGFLVVYGEANISNGSFDFIQNWGTLTMTGGTVKNENENGINYGIWTSVTNGKTDLRNVSITAYIGIYVSTGLRPTIKDGVTINATKYGVDGSATLVGAPVIEGGTADLYIYSMRATTAYPSVDATDYAGSNLTVQEYEFPNAHQGGYIGCAIEVPQEKQNLFSLENSDGNFVYQYDTENSALRLYNTKSHPICGASCDHGDASHSDPAWQQWTSSSGGTLDSGSYYLTSTVTLSQPITVTGDVNLCLNGKTIQKSGGGSPLQVTEGGSLTICDCQATGQLTGGIAANGGHISIYGGTISGGAYAVDLGGGAKLTLAGSPVLSGNTAALKLYTKSGTTLDNAAVDATDYIGDPLNVEEDNVPGGANGFAIKGDDGKFSLTNLSTGYRYAYESGGYVIRPDHTHSFIYSGNGNIITEKCGCGHSATATISIQAGSNLTYTGSAITPAEVTYSDGWQGGKDLTITYSDNINAGTATATITKDNDTASVTFTIEKANQTPPTASEYSIDYFHETITSIASGCKVYTAQTDGTEVAAGSLISDYLGGNLYILREETNNYHASGWETIPLAPRPAAPTVAAEPETIKDKGDGRVTGVDTTMEYSTDGGQNWTPCTGAEITDLAAGTAVLVRVKATATTPRGEAASCMIGASENTLTVWFEENGGSAVTEITGLSYNAAISAPAEPTKTGYAFAGWYQDNRLTDDWDFSSDKVTGDITLYAKWTPAAYSITYHLDGGTASDNPETYTVESEAITLSNPTRTGYTFAGWTGTGLDEATESVTIEKGSTGDRTYTATWTANTYTVAFDKNANDATGEMTAQTFAYGQKQALTANAFTRTGYTFSGWNTEADGSGVKYTDQQEVENLSTTDEATITLYAQWALEGLTVTITGAPEEPVTYGTEITLTAATTHTADGLTYTYQWYKGDAALPGKTESTLTLTDVADSGSYTVEVTAIDGSQSSKASSTSVEVEVIPLGIAVTWSGLTRVYGDNEPKVRAVLGGVLGSDACTLSAITYQQDGTPVTAPTNAGEYTVTVSLTGVDAVNYTLKNAKEILTIRPKSVGFTVSNNAVEGDGTTKTATVTPTDNNLTQTGYTVTYRQGTVTVAAPTAAGSYEIWVEITDGNYRHTNGKTEMQVGTLTITQAPPVLYDVTFAGGADVTGSMAGLEVVGDSVLTLPECAYSRTDHKFTGWLYNGKVYQPGDGFTMPARNVTFTAQWQAVFTVDGIVTEETDGGNIKVENAVVSLWLGANKISEVTTGADGKFRFENLIPGIYNLVVTKDVRTVTGKVELTENTTCNATLPKGATNSIVEVTPGSPDIVVGKLDTVFDSVDEKVYTAEDKQTVLAGGKVEFTFTAEEKQKTEVSEDLQKIQTVSGESNLALVMDYRLDKAVFNPDGTLDTTASKAITQANVLLEVLLPLPAELHGKDSYSVYRVHGGQAQELTMTPSADLGEYFTVSGDKTSLTLYVKCFSTYAIGYSESSGGNGGGSSGGGTSTPTYPPSIEEPEHGSVTISPKNPGKGDQVTITPTPDDGYAVDTVIVTGPDGKEVAVTPNDDGTYTFVQPSGKVTITVIFRQLASVSDCPRDENCPMAPFTDADRNAWYHDGVHYCVEHGLMMGTSQTTFAPDIVTTRGMIVTILWRLKGSPIVGASLDYDDVKAEDWYGEAVRWADSVGVVTGYGNGKFGPNDTITREQMAAMLWRYAGSPKVDGSLSSFTDGAQTSSWAQPAMIWVVEEGLITGAGNDRLEPRGQATRAQAATILMRFAQNMAQ